MKLVIAEKPSVGVKIASVLGCTTKKDGYIEGKDYIVTWAIGHLIGLAEPERYDESLKKWSMATLPIIPEKDKWKLMTQKSTYKQFKIIKGLLSQKNITSVICATDAGREGELIFRYIYGHCGCKKPIERLWISSLEESSIKKGFSELKPGATYDNLFKAAFCRARADWLVGINGSRYFSIKNNDKFSIGRVQTPTLNLIVKRDAEVSSFVKTKFFKVELELEIGSNAFTAVSERIDEETKAKKIALDCSGVPATITDINKQQKSESAPKLYDLTTLEREANRKFGYAAKQTDEYLQSLYEGTLVTYPRTDSQYITADMEKTFYNATILAGNLFGIKIRKSINVKRCINDKKVSDHHAIIATEQIAKKDLTKLSDGEKNILKLICAKMVLSTMDDYKYESTTIEVTSSQGTVFSAKGNVVLQGGFKDGEKWLNKAMKAEEDSTKKGKTEKEDQVLPNIKKGDICNNPKTVITEHFTTPPKHYTEDTLLKAMSIAGNKDYDPSSDAEKKGIGTPATRSGIIDNLISRGYVLRDKKLLKSTAKGKELILAVPEIQKSPALTAKWEVALRKVEKGEIAEEKFMDEIEKYVKELLEIS